MRRVRVPASPCGCRVFSRLAALEKTTDSCGLLPRSLSTWRGTRHATAPPTARAQSTRAEPHPGQEAFLTTTGAHYAEALRRDWLADPASVPPSWASYFSSGVPAVHMADASGPPVPLSQHLDTHATNSACPSVPPSQELDATNSAANSAIEDHMKVQLLIRAYQVRGHLRAAIDPLGIMQPERDFSPAPELRAEYYGFTEDDMHRRFLLGPGVLPAFVGAGRRSMALREILDTLQRVYCGSIGYEYTHVPDRARCDWLRSRIEVPAPFRFSAQKKRLILDRLAWAHTFERFVAAKWPGEKRFGLEGGEALVPGLKALIDRVVAAPQGVEHVVLGMAHRGRLNVLANVARKPLASIFCEFAGLAASAGDGHSGDVKYHLGTAYTRPTPSGRPVCISLVANPSHLEAADPVVLGKVRALQFALNDKGHARAMALLVHGDAAFAGQGVVYETMGMACLPHYTTGGTVHVIVNNQIGFTTDPRTARSTPYPSDLAKAVAAPVLHVNGDDVEAVVHACELAADWRTEFKADVVVDIVCYRRHGHNEVDQPAFTQPHMYAAIARQRPCFDLYVDRLIAEGAAAGGVGEGGGSTATGENGPTTSDIPSGASSASRPGSASADPPLEGRTSGGSGSPTAGSASGMDDTSGVTSSPTTEKDSGKKDDTSGESDGSPTDSVGSRKDGSTGEPSTESANAPTEPDRDGSTAITAQITKDEVEQTVSRIRALLEGAYAQSKDHVPAVVDWQTSAWPGFRTPHELLADGPPAAPPTGVALATLRAVGTAASSYPGPGGGMDDYELDVHPDGGADGHRGAKEESSQTTTSDGPPNATQPFVAHPGVARIMAARRDAVAAGRDIDMPTAEALAFGTLLAEGAHVRLSGQDVERGTFSQRHAVLHDQAAGAAGRVHVPLAHVHGDQGRFVVCNSSLSEFGVLGFELGYSLVDPGGLAVWEAQFGDFANGAQVVIDTFVASGERKWLQRSGLAMLLPHGYDGAGPEHSNARVDRFLALCDDDPADLAGMAGAGHVDTAAFGCAPRGAAGGGGRDWRTAPKPESVSRPHGDAEWCTSADDERKLIAANMHVVYPSTPANYFHVLRRQVRRPYRKPLVVLASKALLRHAAARSALADMGPGTRFVPVYRDGSIERGREARVKRVVLCAGQVYYALVRARDANAGGAIEEGAVAIVRVEQLSPLPARQVLAELARFPAAAALVWCQEEPLNLGMWAYVSPRLSAALAHGGKRTSSAHPHAGKTPLYAGRPPNAGVATGSKRQHVAEEHALLARALLPGAEDYVVARVEVGVPIWERRGAK